MTSASVQRQKRIMLWMIIASVGLLAAVFSYAIPQFIQQQKNQMVFYQEMIITPLQSELCPGDTLEYYVTIVRTDVGSVELLGQWTRSSDGITLLSDSTLNRVFIADQYEPMTFLAKRTVPANTDLTAGSEWEYIRHTHSTDGHAQSSWYRVPFTIKADCPPTGD